MIRTASAALLLAFLASLFTTLCLAAKLKKITAENAKLSTALSYFRFRDSLTGQPNKTFAVKEFSRLRQTSSGAVMVLIKLSEERTQSIKNSEIAETATVLAAIGIGEVCRVENEAFMIFTKNVSRGADKAFACLSSIDFDGLLFAVGGETFTHDDNFNALFCRVKRAAAAADIGGCQCAIY